MSLYDLTVLVPLRDGTMRPVRVYTRDKTDRAVAKTAILTVLASGARR